MGQLWSQDDRCDLNEEQVEEIRMITLLPVKEIHRVRRKYQTIAQHEGMTQEEFYTIPGVNVNPLRDQLFRFFELSAEQRIPFAEFARFVSVYSYHSSRDVKMREAFRIHDFDGDGKISRDDLRTYLSLVTHAPTDQVDEAATEHQDLLETTVSRVFEESSSDPSVDFLVYEDFAKVLQQTDLESHLLIPF